MSPHSFDPQIARDHGINIALIVQYMKDCEGMNGGENLTFTESEMIKRFDYIQPYIIAFDFKMIMGNLLKYNLPLETKAYKS